MPSFVARLLTRVRAAVGRARAVGADAGRRLLRLADPLIRTRRRQLATLASAVALGALISGSWWATCGFDGCPTAAALQAWQPSEGGRVLAHDGRRIGTLDPVRRSNVPLAEVPVAVRAAFLAVEDRRFYEHGGVDLLGVLRAAWRNVRAGGVREGASTITMQLARNAFLDDRTRGWRRKALEVRYAQLIESALPKDTILQHYLNTIYLGAGTYGIDAASRDLFGVPASRLSLAQGALLAGLPKAPSTYTPRRSVAAARTRRDVVLAAMVDAGVLDAAAAAKARETRVAVARKRWAGEAPPATWGGFAVAGVVDSLRDRGAIPRELPDRQLVIHTTLDVRAQRAAQTAIAGGARTLDRRRGRVGRDVTQGALVALDPSSGAIRAIVGGRTVEAGGFDRAREARRQPGSAFKPFAYAVAIADGAQPASPVIDEPITLRVNNASWTPANYGDQYLGRVTYREALARSANSAAVRIGRDIGASRVADLAHRLGVESELPHVPSLPLGSAGVTPLELTAAYAPFANGGWRVTPHLVTRITTLDGRVLWERPATANARVLGESDAFLMTSMLASVVDDGTGRAVRAAGIRGPVAGKTGTTNDGADVWFVGYTPTLVAAVWFGADRPVSLGDRASGGRDAAPVWASFVRDGWHDPRRDQAWQPPPGLVALEVERGTGALANGWCAGETYVEYFRPGSEPREECRVGDAWWRSVFMPDGDRWDDDEWSRDERRRFEAEARREAEQAAREAAREAERAMRNGSTRDVSQTIASILSGRDVRRAITAMPTETLEQLDDALDALSDLDAEDGLGGAAVSIFRDRLNDVRREIRREQRRRDR